MCYGNLIDSLHYNPILRAQNTGKNSVLVWWPTIIILLLSILFGLFIFRLSKLHRFSADSGPSFIDVSNYPAEMQKKYQVFANKCSRCHTLARPINSDFTVDQWPFYVQKMKQKPGSGLTDTTAVQITDFLVFDTKHRKSTSNN